MKPLEKCLLPLNSDLVDPYINGASLRLKSSPFIADRKIYLPVFEISKILGIKAREDAGIIIVENGEIVERFEPTADIKKVKDKLVEVL